MGDWNKSENETHLNQLKNWMSSAIHNSEGELQSCDINDAFALTNVLLRKTLSTCFPKKENPKEKRNRNMGGITNNIRSASAKGWGVIKFSFFKEPKTPVHATITRETKLKKLFDDLK